MNICGLSTYGLNTLEREITSGATGAWRSTYISSFWKYGPRNSYKIGATRFQIL